MSRTIVPCVLSAIGGAVLVVALTGSVPDEPNSIAQAAPVGAAPGVLQVPPAQAAAGSQVSDQADLTPEERVNVSVYKSVNRSVVNITTTTVRSDLFRTFSSEGEGSGSVIDRRGHILTNFHVIKGAREVQVTLFDRKTYDAKPVGFDEATDVAVLKIDAPLESLFPVSFGDSTRLLVGQRVFAIGNPFGLERTLSTGIVSSLNRSLPSQSPYREIKSIIQIDASINPGNSGGPLLDSHGRMIGMNTAIASKTGESAGVGFAIPINTIARIVPQLLKDGRIIRPKIGIAEVYPTERGLLILRLVPGGPAEKAGLQGVQIHRTRQGPFVYQTIDRSAADLIVGADGKRIKTADDLLSIVESKQPGDQVTITVVRQGREARVAVRLEPGE